VTFNIENGGKMRHDFIVFRSDLDTASLPTSTNKVTEAGVGTKIGELEGFKPGDNQSATFDLRPVITYCSATSADSRPRAW